MKAFASPDQSPAAHQRKPARTPPPRLAPLSARSGSQAGRPGNACACGGGCPRCQGKLTLQAKLAIGQPGDSYEQEAERVADRVMRMPESTAGHQGDSPSSTDYQALVTPLIQPQTRSGSTLDVSPSLTADIESARSSGQPLADSVRDFFEPRFGRDFSGVRVHPDFQGSQDLKAQAFTTGQDIFFGQGQYNPDTTTGQKLLAHELTHVVQQKSTDFGNFVQRESYDQWGNPISSTHAEEDEDWFWWESEEEWQEQTRNEEAEKEIAKKELKEKKSTDERLISDSVGKNGANRHLDVRIVQTLLQENQYLIPNVRVPEPNGEISPITIQAIEEYQRQVYGWFDGRVDPDGKTIRSLQEEKTMSETKVDIGGGGSSEELGWYFPLDLTQLSEEEISRGYETIRNSLQTELLSPEEREWLENQAGLIGIELTKRCEARQPRTFTPEAIEQMREFFIKNANSSDSYDCLETGNRGLKLLLGEPKLPLRGGGKLKDRDITVATAMDVLKGHGYKVKQRDLSYKVSSIGSPLRKIKENFFDDQWEASSQPVWDAVLEMAGKDLGWIYFRLACPNHDVTLTLDNNDPQTQDLFWSDQIRAWKKVDQTELHNLIEKTLNVARDMYKDRTKKQPGKEFTITLYRIEPKHVESCY